MQHCDGWDHPRQIRQLSGVAAEGTRFSLIGGGAHAMRREKQLAMVSTSLVHSTSLHLAS